MSNPLDPARIAGKLKQLSVSRPTVALILGSGFQGVLKKFEVQKPVRFKDVPGFSSTGVVGHAGSLSFIEIDGTAALVLNGRIHFYEGYSMDEVTRTVRVLAAYGIRDLLLTNAAGGIHPGFRPGDFMLVTDHINLMGVNPLRGESQSGVPRFVDLTHAYDARLRRLMLASARKCGIKLQTGVYLAVSGPSYETPAEIRAFRRMGADAVGMSTVPEVIVARQYGLNVAALSCITNLAAGRSGKELSHAEVLGTAEKVKSLAEQLLESFVKFYGRP